jgi:hypothetical protein
MKVHGTVQSQTVCQEALQFSMTDHGSHEASVSQGRDAVAARLVHAAVER